ncbi:MAG: hypothetical protein KAW49_06175, partial [Anaerolineae bacterium]|nr:hypothetical protein [Anaerolineae bacterium]
VSPFYEQLAMEVGDFAIAPLPSTRQKAKYFMYYQTIHGKKIVGGVVSRTPREATRFMEEHELIWSLCTTWAVDSEITDISRQFDRLAEVDIRYLVLHKDQLTNLEPADAEALKAALETNFELVESDAPLRIYRAYPLRSNSQ